MKQKNKETKEKYIKLKPPKVYYYITEDGEMWSDEDIDGILDIKRKRIGNYFKSEKEVFKAYKKLLAWKRLKDKGFKFSHYEIDPKRGVAIVEVRAKRGPVFADQAAQFVEDLDLIFGGKE